jgi:hypothetical protein
MLILINNLITIYGKATPPKLLELLFIKSN